MTKDFNFRQTPDFAQLERDVLKFWQEHKIFEQSLAQRQDSEYFSFYDGPPFATGLPHYGHLLQSIVKDLIPRYQTMQGKYVRRVWGWDCHGLPIENLMEKKLGLADKQAIEDYGVAEFNQACRDTVLTYADDWQKTIERIGRWIDMDHAYKTMDLDYMESVWWVFKQLYDRGLIYQSYKPMHICPHCSTPLSNFEVSQGYQDVTDLAVTVKFALLDDQGATDTYVLAWTTTAWTLPGNTFLAINPELDYQLLQLEHSQEKVYVAAQRVEAVMVGRSYQVLKTVKGQDLVGLSYQPVFPYFADLKTEQELPDILRQLLFTVQAADFVTLDEGTGIVHVAPAFGEDDYYLAESLLHLSTLDRAVRDQIFIQHVDLNGRFKKEVLDFAGQLVKPQDSPQQIDRAIADYLDQKKLLFNQDQVQHSYPHCWRCNSPLLNYATNSWFVRVSGLKDQLLANNEQINWQPAHIKYGRFGRWLEGARDWAISRNRFWGTPLPLWQSDNGELLCLGSVAELEELSGQKVTDLHKHLIDQLEIEHDGQIYHRVPEVLDCWFESGAMPYAQLHYPFANQELFDNTFPADFISEGLDQTRGWFYTLHVLATALKQQPAFKNVMCTGLLMAADGKKMSKSLNNYPEPTAVIDRYGADSLRVYLIVSPAVKAETLNFQEKDVADIRRRVFLVWWNVLAFYKTFADQQAGLWPLQAKQAPQHVLDRWILSRLASLRRDLIEHLDHFEVMQAGRLLAPFINELSTWYLRLSRNRLKSQDNQQVSQVFAAVLYTTAQLFAPLTPFFSELIHHSLIDQDSSVHLTDYPRLDTDLFDSQLEEQMAELRQLVEIGHAQRKTDQVPLRQALASVTINQPLTFKDNQELLALLKQELNVKEIKWLDDKAKDLAVSYDLKLTPELKAEGEARVIIRRIQNWRRKAGLAVNDVVEVQLKSWPPAWQETIENKTNTHLVSGQEEGLQNVNS